MFRNSITKGLSLLLAINFIGMQPVYSIEYTQKSTSMEDYSSTNEQNIQTEEDKKIKALEAQIELLKEKKTQKLKQIKGNNRVNNNDKTHDDEYIENTNRKIKETGKNIPLDKETIRDKTSPNSEKYNKTRQELIDEETDRTTKSGKFRNKEDSAIDIEEIEDKEVVKKTDERPKPENIYPWLPSMSNLFEGQTLQESKTLKPFGYDLFNKDSSVLESNNIDAPVGNDYIIGPGDNLQINIWGGVNTSLDVTVDREGKIILPEVGTFVVSGRSFGSLKDQIRQKLSEIFNNVSVDVSLTKMRKLKIYVVGEAKHPGTYDITSANTLFNVLFMAGGPTNIGSLRNISIRRNNRVVKTIDLYDFILKGDKSADIKLENGDTVYFNLKGKTVGVQGLVMRPAIYELKNEKNLSQVLSLAGGAVATSYLKNVQVRRVEANKEMVILNVDLSSKSKVASFAVKDNDMINIAPILPVNNQTIYLNGHVFRPGSYQYRSKMKLSDVIKSYNDLLPEPYTEYAQIVRLQKPDLKPFTIMFNLGDVISRKKDIELQPFDTIIIYSKWDFTRVPEIAVQGEIFNPGFFKIVKGTRLIDIISSAGGITKDTYLDRVEIIRKDDTYGNKRTISVSLRNALKGDTKHNIEIKDEDTVIFHSNKDITEDKSVTIAGQITKPGSYPLGKSMRVKDLLNLGGNFTKSAFNREAELIRYTSDGADVKFKTIVINLQRVIAGDPAHNIVLQDLDRLLIKQVPNWSDIGMAIELKGQVKYPGVYAVSPNDRLEDVINRAGGFLNDAYLKAAVYTRKSVMELQKERLEKLINDIDSSIIVEETQLTPDRAKNMTPSEIAIREKRLTYRKQLLDKLKTSQATGRMIIDLTDRENFKDSDNNVKITDGDILFIPKRPDFVSVQGEVYNQTAIVYKPGKTLGYYLSQAGGTTPDGDNSRINLVKADGRVVSNNGRWLYDIRNEVIEPGDTILVPQVVEKTDYMEMTRSLVDIAYKTATAAGIFFLNR